MFKQFVIILLAFVLMTSMIMMIILVSNSFFNFIMSWSLYHRCSKIILPQAQKIHFYCFSLWIKFLWSLKPCLDLEVFPHWSQTRETPSKCLVSMWSLMATHWPSFPQILQTQTLVWDFPTDIRLALFSIKDFTFSSSCRR